MVISVQQSFHSYYQGYFNCALSIVSFVAYSTELIYPVFIASACILEHLCAFESIFLFSRVLFQSISSNLLLDFLTQKLKMYCEKEWTIFEQMKHILGWYKRNKIMPPKQPNILISCKGKVNELVCSNTTKQEVFNNSYFDSFIYVYVCVSFSFFSHGRLFLIVWGCFLDDVGVW